MQWSMLQQDAPDDFVIATGEQHLVHEFVTIAAQEMGIEIRWCLTCSDELSDEPFSSSMGSSHDHYILSTTKIRWEGQGVDERGYDNATSKQIVVVDPRYFCPTEVDTLLCNPAKAKQRLSCATKISFTELISEMVAADLCDAERDILRLFMDSRLVGYLAQIRLLSKPKGHRITCCCC